MMILLWAIFLHAATAVGSSIFQAPKSSRSSSHLLSKRNINAQECGSSEAQVLWEGYTQTWQMLKATENRLNVLISYLNLPQPYSLHPAQRIPEIGITSTTEVALLLSTLFTWRKLVDSTLDTSTIPIPAPVIQRIRYVRDLARYIADNLEEQPFVVVESDRNDWVTEHFGQRFPTNPLNVELRCDDSWLDPLKGLKEEDSHRYIDNRHGIEQDGEARGRPVVYMPQGLYHSGSHDELPLRGRPAAYVFNHLEEPYSSVINFDPAKFESWGSIVNGEPYFLLRAETSSRTTRERQVEIPLESVFYTYFAPTFLHAITDVRTISPADALSDVDCGGAYLHARFPHSTSLDCIVDLAKYPDRAIHSAQTFMFLNTALYLDKVDWSTGKSKKLNWRKSKADRDT